MNTTNTDYTHSRRTVLRLSAAACLLPGRRLAAFGKSDFWNQKDPSQWSDAEKERVLANSPWAKKATVSMTGADLGEGGMGGRGGGMGGGAMGGGAMGGGAMGGAGGRGGGAMGGGPPGGMDGGPMGGGMPKFDVMVRWESAGPVRAASKHSLAADPESCIISLSGMPVNMGGRGGMRPGSVDGTGNERPQVPDDSGMLENLRQSAQIEVKGQAPLHPKKIERGEGPGGALFFFFDKGELPITQSVKEVTFSVKMGPMQLKAKFVPKDMVYGDKVSV